VPFAALPLLHVGDAAIGSGTASRPARSSIETTSSSVVRQRSLAYHLRD
jgi:hypothetical protein